MAKTMLTNGTSMFIVDPSAETPQVYKVCATQFELNNGEPTKIDVTTLCETEKTQEVDGLLGSSTSTFTINFDDESAVHKFLTEAQDKRDLEFCVAWSGDNTEPEWDAVNGGWKPLTDRTTTIFSGSLAPFSISFQPNAVVQIQLSINMKSMLKTILKEVK